MKLRKVRVSNFMNFLDSGDVDIANDVTCLVGKNESGKTAFLQALYRLQPARPNVKYFAPDQYPAWLEKRDRLRGHKLEEFKFVRAEFECEDVDLEVLTQHFGLGALKTKLVTVKRDYTGTLWYTLDLDEVVAVQNAVGTLSLPGLIAKVTGNVTTFSELQEYATGLVTSESDEDGKAGTLLNNWLKTTLGGKTFSEAAWTLLSDRLPVFFYYHEYSNLPYTVKIQELLKADRSKLNDDQLTALSLLRLAAADDAYILNPDYERRKRELENVANTLTLDVLKYWTQNPELRVQPDITQTTVTTQQGQQSVLDELKIRIWDQRHSLSLPFDQHSSGFRWFFSFLAAFSEYEFRDSPVVILLDEPALGLHARAQSDFLRFIDERLAARCQVIYTTHSPFMIQVDKLERTRVVEDLGQDKGARISSDVLTTDPDTLFPLQGALGYDMAQHLFIAPHNLVVEGTSDFTYLSILSSHLQTLGRTVLDQRWSIVPVGGADLIPTFVVLLGQHLEITVVVDAQKAGHQRLSRLAADGYLKDKRIITIGDILGRKLADVEDLFTIDDYLLLYNLAFNRSLTASHLKGTDPIVSRIVRHEKIARFDHGRPADVFLRKRDELLPKLSAESIDNFERLFVRINSTLGM